MNNWKKDILNIPNLLSLFRLVLIPVYVHIYLNASASREYWLAGFILAISCLTDMVDGKIARKFNMISELGKVLDPLGDKVTQAVLACCLATKYDPMKLLFLVLFACAKSGLFNKIALVVPLVFVRPTLTLAEFFRKKEAR